MKQHPEIKTRKVFPLKALAVVVAIFSVIAIAHSALKEKKDLPVHFGAAAEAIDASPEITEEADALNKDSIASAQAFLKVYKVLMSPRCMNCHPSGDIPLQGDDSHLHTMFPKRGKDGKGIYAMKCSNCHQPENTAGLHTPPGNPEWHLPPADMKMVFQGRTAHQLARQLMDPKQNGNKTKEQLIKHADDGLVLACWNPGEGRTIPPMSHVAFKKEWITWISKGGYAPPAK